jgi:hypothetical protein
LLTALTDEDDLIAEADQVSREIVAEVTRPLADVGWQPTASRHGLHWKPHNGEVKLTFDATAAAYPRDRLNTWRIWAGQDIDRAEWVIRASDYTPASILSHLAGELAHGIGARQHHPRPLKLPTPSATTLPSRPPHQPPAPRLR